MIFIGSLTGDQIASTQWKNGLSDAIPNRTDPSYRENTIGENNIPIASGKRGPRARGKFYACDCPFSNREYPPVLSGLVVIKLARRIRGKGGPWKIDQLRHRARIIRSNLMLLASGASSWKGLVTRLHFGQDSCSKDISKKDPPRFTQGTHPGTEGKE